MIEVEVTVKVWADSADDGAYEALDINEQGEVDDEVMERMTAWVEETLSGGTEEDIAGMSWTLNVSVQ